MNNFKKTALLLLMLLAFASNVHAATCDTSEQAQLNSEVVNIKGYYEIKQRVMDKSEYIAPDGILGTDEESSYEAIVDYAQINILNLTENFYVEVSNDVNEEKTTYTYNDSDNGNLAISQNDMSEVVNYTIKVYTSSSTGCAKQLMRTIYVTVPRYNAYSEESICSGLDDYALCSEYVTTDSVSFEDFYNLAEAEQEKREEQEQKENEKWYEKVADYIKEHKTAFIIGGVAIIVIAGSTTAVIIIKRKRSII